MAKPNGKKEKLVKKFGWFCSMANFGWKFKLLKILNNKKKNF